MGLEGPGSAFPGSESRHAGTARWTAVNLMPPGKVKPALTASRQDGRPTFGDAADGFNFLKNGLPTSIARASPLDVPRASEGMALEYLVG